MRDKALLAIVAFVAYVAAILTISTKCLDRQYYQPTSASTRLGNFQILSTEYSTSATTSSNGRLCDNEESLEDYFRVRFQQEIQNLLNGNETEYVRQIKMIHSQRIKEDLELRVQSVKQEYESKIASIESNNQQHILDMKKKHDSESNNNDDMLFPTDRVGNYVVNMARVSRDSFNTTFFSSQFGYEFMDSYFGTKDLLLLYGSDDTIPNNFSTYRNGEGKRSNVPYIEDAVVATENCDELRVVFVSQHRQMRQCLAIVPNLESFHVHPLVRPSMFADPTRRTDLLVNHTQPFQFKSRYHRIQMPSEALLPPPRFQQETKVFFNYLKNYLNAVDTVLQELRTILSNIAIDNQVIIMMCNYGQAVLLNNFICTAQARNINLSNLIVFTTDQETTDLVTSFGLTAYFDQGVRILYTFYRCGIDHASRSATNPNLLSLSNFCFSLFSVLVNTPRQRQRDSGMRYSEIWRWARSEPHNWFLY
jgi:hypothetical protein